MRANYLNLLLVLLVGIIPMKMQASESGKNVFLYTPYTKISVPPGESLNYSIDVINNSNEIKNATIRLDGLPRGWKYEIKAGGWTVSQLSVLPNEKKNFTLKIDVPLKINKGTYHLLVAAEGAESLPLSITVSRQGTYQTEFTTSQPNMQGNSKANFTFNATLKNQTAEQQLYALMARAPRGWDITFKANYKQATSAQLEPNTTQNITIDIVPPANIEAGTYEIPVMATTNSTAAELKLEVVITGTYQMEIGTPRGLLSADITAGDTKRLDLVIRNDGSAELRDIQLAANKPIDWEVNFEPAQIDRLKPGETANAIAIIKASQKALPGDYATKITAKTPEVNSAADFRISVRTPMLWGWVGILVIIAALGVVYYLFRKYGRR